MKLWHYLKKNSKKKAWEMIEAAGNYILTKIDMTECMQKHFRQVCHKCNKYSKCKLYSEYVESWINLQKAFLEETEK